MVYSLVDDDVLCQRQAIRLSLRETLPIGRGEDNLIVMPLGGQFGDDTVDRLYLQHHPRAKTKRVIIHLAMFIQGVVAQVVHINLSQTLVLRPLHDRVVQRRFQQLRTSRNNINSHNNELRVFNSALLRVQPAGLLYINFLYGPAEALYGTGS